MWWGGGGGGGTHCACSPHFLAFAPRASRGLQRQFLLSLSSYQKFSNRSSTFIKGVNSAKLPTQRKKNVKRDLSITN
jgi:hypothetical protein